MKVLPRGMAIPAVLALLASVASLMLAYGLLATTNWLAARNLREGLHAWTRAESATALVLEELGAAHGRRGALPDAYALPPGAFEDVVVVYVAHDADRAKLEVLARVGKAASRRVLEVDMSRG